MASPPRSLLFIRIHYFRATASFPPSLPRLSSFSLQVYAVQHGSFLSAGAREYTSLGLYPPAGLGVE